MVIAKAPRREWRITKLARLAVYCGAVTVGLGLVAALLAPVIPFALELAALRRLTAAAFGTLMALEPALGTLVGAVALAQLPNALQVVGVGLVVIAGIGAERGGHRGDEPARLDMPGT